MLKNLIVLATLIVLALLATLVGCSEPTPAPDPTATPAAMAAATQAPTETPAPTANPTAATAAKPTSSPTPEPTTTPIPDGRLAPIQMQDSGALLSALSETELACIGDDPEQLTRALTGAGPSSRDEQGRLLGCLNDETLARLFFAGFVPGPEPLSLESSECVREAFEVIDPRAVMTAGAGGDPGKAMAGSMAAMIATIACLSDEEWEKAGPAAGASDQDRAGGQCLMAVLGGPGKLAEAMLAAQEGDLTSMANAAAECGLDMGPMPPTPPTATSIAATPAPAPTTPMLTPTPAATATTTPSTPAATLVITIVPIPVNTPEYSRSEWKHWTDEDGDCQDARQEVLIAESLVAVTFETDRECRVETGQWWAPHLGHHLENPSHIDVDHHVPLKNAHDSGGWRWDAATKEEYANYLEDDAHLVAISSRHNRSKGARGPEKWAPPDNALWCQYAVDWAVIKEKWELTMTPVESEMVMDMLGTCENPPEFEVETLDYLGTVTGEDKPESEPLVYGSCEEAAVAGEVRVQGTSGDGRGFLTERVPSARDGDSDGVVCET